VNKKNGIFFLEKLSQAALRDPQGPENPNKAQRQTVVGYGPRPCVCVSLFYVIDTVFNRVPRANLGVACLPSALSLTLALPSLVLFLVLWTATATVFFCFPKNNPDTGTPDTGHGSVELRLSESVSDSVAIERHAGFLCLFRVVASFPRLDDGVACKR
jgi:hypothetical protein